MFSLNLPASFRKWFIFSKGLGWFFFKDKIMKKIFEEIGLRTLMMLSIFVYLAAIAWPFALAFNDGPPLWSCWVVYPLTVVFMSTQRLMINKLTQLEDDQ